MKKKYKKIVFRVLLSLIVSFVVLLLLVPLFFKKELTSLVKSEINKRIETKVDFNGFSASLWKDFPNLTLQINDLTMWGSAPFEDDTLATIEKSELQFDLVSLLRKKETINIHSFSLQNPIITLQVDTEDVTNYQITKKSDEATPDNSGSSLSMIVKKYQIIDGHLAYADKTNDLKLNIQGLSHEGSGNFNIGLFDLVTQTEIDSITVVQHGMAYMQNIACKWNAILGIDQNQSTLTLKDNLLSLNSFDFSINGTVLMGERPGLDLQVDVQNEPFKSLLSIVPEAFTKDFERVKTDGTFSLIGNIQGSLDASNHVYPQFEISLDVMEGSIQYPGFAKSIDNIQVQASLFNPDSSLRQMYAVIPQSSFQLDQEPVFLSLEARSLMRDPHIKGKLEGKARLEDWAEALPVENLERLSGKVQALINLDFKQSAIEAGAYEDIVFSGRVEAESVLLKYVDQPEYRLDKGLLTMTPGQWIFQSFAGVVRSTHFSGDLQIKDPLAYFSSDRKSTSTLNILLDQIIADEWLDDEDVEDNDGQMMSTILPSPLKKVDVNGNISMDQLKYGSQTFTNVRAKVFFADDLFRIQQATFKESGQPSQITGEIGPVWDYLYNKDTLAGLLLLKAPGIDLNHYLVSDVSSDTGIANEPVTTEIPDRLNIRIQSNIDRVQYSKYDIRNVDAEFLLHDKTFSAEQITGKAFGGDIQLAGSYATRPGTQPQFNFKYGLKNLDFQAFFNSVNTVQILAPVGKFLKGSFSSDMVANGALTPSMMPDFTSLNMAGFLETFNGSLQKFPPLEKLGNQLKIEELKNWIIKDTKNWFEVSEGQVELMPFDLEMNDIQLNISGNYHFGKQMNFLIKAGIPRSILNKSSIGAQANEGVRLLENQAKTLGINFSTGDYVYLDAFLSGKMNDPQIKIQLTGVGGKKLQEVIEERLEAQVKAYKDTLAQRVENEIDKKKEEAAKYAQKAKDSLTNVIKQKGTEYLDSAKTKVKKETLDTLQKTVDDLLKTKLGKDSVLVNPKKDIDQINQVLKDFNPFKKKDKKMEKDTSSGKKEE